VETLEGQERKRHLDARPLSVTEPPLRPAIPDRLRILFVVHQYLPRHESGTEVYTHHLARSLSRDHEVLVLAAESDPDRPRFEERRRNFEGVPIHEVIHNYRWEHFRETYDCPEADAIFRRLLTEFAPDVVHVQHLHYFSSNFVTIAHSRGIPVVYTLHDYMLLCPRDGTLRRADGEICQRPIPIKCRDCISHHPQLGESPPLLPRALRPGADTLVPGDVARIVRSLRTGDETTDDYADAVSQRLDYLRHVLRDVDLFLSPSAFLKERFVEAGLVPSDRIEVSDNGYDLSRFPAEPAPWTPPTDRLRVGYVGTIAEHKGIHVLIEALNGITDPRVGGRIWGDLVAFFDYAERIRALICHPDTLLLGPFPNSRIDDVLQGIDLLVIPSLWFENSPLTVHEAAACGVPVLASDQGGLAEYVHPEVTGRLFRLGDADHLREQILSFLERPLTTFDPRRLPLKSIEDDAAAMTRRYRTLMDRTHRTGRALLR
jgi:glycosyltransferase involved in cell wall biosynthesis